MYRESVESVRDLPRECVTYVKWRASYRREDAPEPGGTWSYGDWDQCAPEDATHVLLNYTGYSDYSGSSADRSNHRALMRDYPETFTNAYGGHGTEELMLSVDWTPPGDGRDGLLDAIAALADYPLYDEEDHSYLEMEAADDAWDQFLSWDVPRDLAEKSESPEAMEDALEALEALSARHSAEYPATVCQCGHVSRNWDAMITHLERFRSLRDMYYESLRDQNESPYLEDAANIYFPCHADSIEQIAERIWRERCADLPQIAGWYNPNQAVLSGMPRIREDQISTSNGG